LNNTSYILSHTVSELSRCIDEILRLTGVPIFNSLIRGEPLNSREFEITASGS